MNDQQIRLSQWVATADHVPPDRVRPYWVSEFAECQKMRLAYRRNGQWVPVGSDHLKPLFWFEAV